MDLEFSADEEAFREKAREWLRTNVPKEPLASMNTADGFEQHRAWERRLHRGGWSAVSWPPMYGGRGATLTEWLVFEEEYWASGAPGRVSQNGVFLLGPTLLEHGTEEQKARYLPPMASGAEIWCQGWSEPDAGSDLASLTSRAVRRGDRWVLHGQKTWCSRGAFADSMFGLFRSDPKSERHRGITYILVPLDAEGVTVRPIVQLDGATGFAEVFLDGVEVPLENTVGPAGEGWRIAMATAGFERGLLLRSPGRFLATATRLVELYRAARAGAPASLRDDVVQAWMDTEAYRLFTLWTVSRVAAGGTIGAESSLNKLFWSEMDLRLHEAALELLGVRAELGPGATEAFENGRWLEGLLFAMAGPIYAGTNEIQRNIVAERVLGLPKG